MRAGKLLLGLAAAGAAGACYLGCARPWQQNWGASRAEREAALPGDEVISHPWMNATRAVSIDAPPDSVWPWLLQMGGYTRGGWYSRDWIDNGGRPSAETIVPELQSLHVGDVMATGPDGSGFGVEAIDMPRTLLLAIRRSQITISSVYELTPEAGNGTRLVNRVRLRPRHGLAAFLLWLAMDTGELYMARPMLLGIKRRAEGLQTSSSRKSRVPRLPTAAAPSASPPPSPSA